MATLTQTASLAFKRETDAASITFLLPPSLILPVTVVPVWMAAYTYPNNVNKDGVLMANCDDEHCRALPQPVFPTPFYETIVSTLLFLILLGLPKLIKVPGFLFGIYLVVN